MMYRRSVGGCGGGGERPREIGRKFALEGGEALSLGMLVCRERYRHSIVCYSWIWSLCRCGSETRILVLIAKWLCSG